MMASPWNTLFAEELLPPATETPVARALAIPESVSEYIKQYYAKGSPLKAEDTREVSMSEAEFVVHLFQKGPGGESFFPNATILSGDQCEKAETMEFATRWQRDENRQLQLVDADLMVSPAYDLKSRDTAEKKKIYNLPEPIIGTLTPIHIEIGDYSLAFTDANYKVRLADKLIQVESVYSPNEPKDSHFVSFRIKTRKSADLPFEEKIVRIDTQKKAELAVVDPLDNKKVFKATLMPYAVHFKKKGETLLEEAKQWGVVSSSGTALHGADWEHIQPRGAENIGSAGCARLQSRFARGIWESMKSLLEGYGGKVDEAGQLSINETDYTDPTTGRKGEKIDEDEQNFKNLMALHDLRKNVQIKGFMKASLETMYQDAVARMFEGVDLARSEYDEASRIIGQVDQSRAWYQNRNNEIDNEIRKLDRNIRGEGFTLFRLPTQQNIANWQGQKSTLIREKAENSKKQNDYDMTANELRVKMASLEYFLPYANDMSYLEQIVNSAVAQYKQESYPKSIQMIYIYAQRKKELDQKIAKLANPEMRFNSLYAMDQDEYKHYTDPAVQERLRYFFAKSLGEYYRGKYAKTGIPARCQAHLESSERLAGLR